ncbi:hypothetical protein BBBOND_0309680 [Babesia bigemina]|uniref:Uncharacterized protein n=1 Tax=Babesia bigemina TaxID=5866 RepID=A0A061DED0_BABBI|nr:hypothetical protein BBBOND_0309680 [Babesia bigemina]CDR97065.1 hypothetical protein BBBOND_0309680 [Babesia bigemina]|eukprot:XP_012769251.1 hypothetical protein BBBOND_0309680 [Babesia bigemina]
MEDGQCPWLRCVLMSGRLRGLGVEREDELYSTLYVWHKLYRFFGVVSGSGYKCDPSACEKQCKQCSNPRCQCECPCCKSRNGGISTPDCSSHSPGAASSRSQQQTLTLPYSTSPSDSQSSSPAPYIIAAVALIIVVICAMVYFRIRPFHRVRYLLRS